MPLSPFRLPFLYPALRLPRPAGIPLRRCRHGTAVEPTPTPADGSTAAPKDDAQAPNPPTTTSPNTTAPASSSSSSSSSSKTSDNAAPASPSPASSSTTTTTTTTTTTLAPGEWTHHFDTYNLAASLTRGDFRPAQSVTIMKSIRSLLSTNLEIAHTNLVSKSNVENESYLFHAACAELRNEVVQTRKTQIDALRAEGAAIRTSYDLLNQKFLEDVMALKDELNGLFGDRKMVTRAEQRAMENKIQELNYKITVLFNSELRSEIEKLRWTTTRRGLIAIAALAAFVVTSIRMSKDSAKKDKKKSSTSSGEKHTNEGDTHDFDSRLGHADLLTESLANPGGSRSSSGASFVSLG
ncbi:uncharacterized protein H6S33_012383 [Morchella sextelata]|uniref:uncharacterized protein n=1 Tax=Morchella sextelata TaxID=1174677 RepID=UPI001D04A21F|nr:uncharacterized protein H6S33_012383 [Morchella sextelata]KAH0609837.1 hypothetical protein H6S33_012383 [Morchella sextelata]